MVFKCTFNKKLAEHPVKVAWIAQDTKGVAPENYGEKLGVSGTVWQRGFQHASLLRCILAAGHVLHYSRPPPCAEVVAVRVLLPNHGFKSWSCFEATVAGPPRVCHHVFSCIHAMFAGQLSYGHGANHI